jgi:hypothetical protein
VKEVKKQDKSWKNAELVLYPEQLEKMLEVLNSGWVRKWAWILHDHDKKADGTPKENHMHLMCQWAQTTKTSVICNKFGCRENQIEKIKGRWADALDYLDHANAPDKYQYDPSEVHANFDWEEEAKESKSNQSKKLDMLIEGITSGDIRAYNMTDYITGEEYVRHERKIRSAFAYRSQYVKAHLEELVEMKDIVWIYGQTGTGKTTFAKECAKGYELAYTLTSLGKNPFDDYQDEPCVIVDDLRPDDLKFQDLLGVLDPYNFKNAAARYHNKALQTQLIIVTTILSPEAFAKACNGEELGIEDARQLYRRINTVFEITKEEVIEYEYDSNSYLTRDVVTRYPNFWLKIKQNEQRKRGRSVIERMAEDAMKQLDGVNAVTA